MVRQESCNDRRCSNFLIKFNVLYGVLEEPDEVSKRGFIVKLKSPPSITRPEAKSSSDSIMSVKNGA